MFSSSVFSYISWNLNTSDKKYISIDKIPFIHWRLLGSLILTDSRAISIMQQRENKERGVQRNCLIRYEYIMLIQNHELYFYYDPTGIGILYL